MDFSALSTGEVLALANAVILTLATLAIAWATVIQSRISRDIRDLTVFDRLVTNIQFQQKNLEDIAKVAERERENGNFEEADKIDRFHTQMTLTFIESLPIKLLNESGAPGVKELDAYLASIRANKDDSPTT